MRAHCQALLVGMAMLAAASTVAAQQAVRWQTNLEAARQTAVQTNRLLLVHFWSETCEPCARMDRDVFSRPDVAAALEPNYVPVKINVRQFPMTAQQFRVTSWPTDLVVTPHGQVLDRSVGYQPAGAYVSRLNQVAALARTQPASPQTASAYNASQPAPRPAWDSQTVSPPPAQAAYSPGQAASPPTQALSQKTTTTTPAMDYGVSPTTAPAAGQRWPGETSAPSTQSPQTGGSAPVWQRSPAAQAAAEESTRRYGSAVSAGNGGGQGPGAVLPGRFSSPPLQQAAANANGSAYSGGLDPQGQRGHPPQMGPSWPSALPPRAEDPATGAAQGAPIGGMTAQNPPETRVSGAQGASPDMATQPVPTVPTGGGYTRPEPPRASGAAPRANPPLALDGYCAVSLTEKERWVRGNPRFGVIHEGRTYLFAGPEEARRFYNDPDRYAPVASGNDVVLLAERGERVPGRREHGAWYEGRVYLFASEDSYSKFAADPRRYAASVSSNGSSRDGASSASSSDASGAPGSAAAGPFAAPPANSAVVPGASQGARTPGSQISAGEPNALRREPPWRY